MYVLGSADLVLGLCQLFMVLITQFTLISYVLTGGLYFIVGGALIGSIEVLRKIYLYSVIPISGIAAWNITAMGAKDVPDYFYTPPEVQLKITIILILVPLILNMLVLNLPKVKAQFK
jgi:hypothetical protein